MSAFWQALLASGGSRPSALLPYPTRNLMQWLDTQQNSYNFDSDGSWLDLSGNNRHATVPGGWNKPQLAVNPTNNLRGLRFDSGGVSGVKARFSLPSTAFVFCVVDVPTLFPAPGTGPMLFDELDGNYRYGIYYNDGIYKIAKGGSYGNYASNKAGLCTLAWDGLLLAQNNADFTGSSIGNPQQTVNGLTIGASATGLTTSISTAYYHLFLVYSERPTDAEITQLVAAAHSNFSIPA